MLPLPDLDVVVPRTLDEALAALQSLGDSARIVAGGTDVLPSLKRGLDGARPDGSARGRVHTLVSVARIAGMDAVRMDGDALHLGARASIAHLAQNPLVRETIPAFADAARLVASPVIRTLATLGGNLCLDTRCPFVDRTTFWREALGGCLKKDGTACHVVDAGRRCVAASSADLPPILVALEASVRVVSPRGERIVPIDALHRNDGASALTLAHDEILVEAIVPRSSFSLRASYRKLRFRQAIDFPLLGVAISLRADDRLRALRVVANGIAPMPKSVGRLEAFLGRPLDDALVEDVAERCKRALAPVDNVCADTQWRREMIPVLVRDAFDDARKSAR